MELLKKSNGNLPRTEQEVNEMIDNAAYFYGKFLQSVGFDYEADRQTVDTPRRVAKAWLKDLIVGSITDEPNITVFPNDEGYKGLVIQSGIPIVSMYAHHNLAFTGYATVAYVPSDNVIGLSKLNRIVEHFGRRGAIQEQLTVAIHSAVNTIIQDNKGVAVMIEATHNCVQCRGVKHGGASMKTSKLTGAFKDDPATRNEFYEFVKGYND